MQSTIILYQPQMNLYRLGEIYHQGLLFSSFKFIALAVLTLPSYFVSFDIDCTASHICMNISHYSLPCKIGMQDA